MSEVLGDGSSPNPLLNLDPAVAAERDELFRYVLTPIRVLLAVRKIHPPKVNPYLLLDAIVHTRRDILQFPGPDAFKMGGHLGFWIARIKPFRMMDTAHIFTNERLGLLIAMTIVGESMGHKQLHHRILQNLFYDLRYGTVAPMAFSNQLQLLYSQEYATKQSKS